VELLAGRVGQLGLVGVMADGGAQAAPGAADFRV
jgi:hypothetical protein